MNDRLPDRVTAACLRAATIAPSIHNTQPWLFRLDGNAIEVFPDPARAVPVIDPNRRAMHISIGAAVCNLRLALAAEGRPTRLVTPAGAAAVARVEPDNRREPTDGVRALAAAINRRRTNRGPFADMAVTADLFDALRTAAAAPGVRLAVPDPVHRGAILALTRAADGRQRADPAYRRELAAWAGTDSDRPDGVTAATFGPRATTSTLPQRDFGLQLPGLERDVAQFERHPQLVVLYSRGDTSAAWLAAGRALQRVLLTATVYGLAVQPMTQALEVPAFRQYLADPAGRWHAQMILRVGYGHPVPTGHRRPVRAVLAPSSTAPASSAPSSTARSVACAR